MNYYKIKLTNVSRHRREIKFAIYRQHRGRKNWTAKHLRYLGTYYQNR